VYEMTNLALRDLSDNLHATFMAPPKLRSARAFGAVQGKKGNVTFTVTGRQEIHVPKHRLFQRPRLTHHLVIVAGPTGGACVLDPVVLCSAPEPLPRNKSIRSSDLQMIFEACFSGKTSAVPMKAHRPLLNVACQAEQLEINGIGVQSIPCGPGLVPPTVNVHAIEQYLAHMIIAANALAI